MDSYLAFGGATFAPVSLLQSYPDPCGDDGWKTELTFPVLQPFPVKLDPKSPLHCSFLFLFALNFFSPSAASLSSCRAAKSSEIYASFYLRHSRQDPG